MFREDRAARSNSIRLRSFEGLQDRSLAELLDLLLGELTKGVSEPVVRRLASSLADSRTIADCTATELASHARVPVSFAQVVCVARELGRRTLLDPIVETSPILGSAQVFRHFDARLRGIKKERFFVLLLDGRHRFLGEHRVSEGTLTASLVHPREVFRPAIRAAAAAILLAHNHPSGDPAPSREDEVLTSRLAGVGELLGIKVLDHVVIGQGRYFSFADSGMLRPSLTP